MVDAVEAKKSLPGLYLIITAPDGPNQLEILESFLYYHQIKRGRQGKIVGIAYGMEEAKEQVRRMTEDVYRETGSVSLKAYFER